MVRNILTLVLTAGAFVLNAEPSHPSSSRPSSPTGTDVSSLVRQERFSEAHTRLQTRLRTGDNEAHFELCRTLLTELQWAFARFPATQSSTAEIREAARYTGFLRNSDGRYRLIHLPVETMDLPFTVVAYWARFDYASLVESELERYLRGPHPRHESTARAWRSELRSAAGFAEIMPVDVLHVFDIPDAGKKDILRTISIAAVLKSGRIAVGSTNP